MPSSAPDASYTTRPAVRSIECTQCGGALPLHGGHRVESVTCLWCGSVLDGQAGYAVLKAHAVDKGRRSYLPLQLGERGRLKGVDFTVIGFTTWRADGDSWIDFVLFSATHGYAWLSVGDGHWELTRRLRDVPSAQTDWRRLTLRAPIRLGRRRFRFYETYAATVTDFGGELTAQLDKGQRVIVSDAIDPPNTLTRTVEGDEVVYELAEYLTPEQVREAFRLPSTRQLPRPSGVHPSQPFNISPLGRAMQNNGLIFSGLAIALLLWSLISGSGQVLLREVLPGQALVQPDGVLTAPFTVTRPNRLLKLTFDSPISNGWMWLDFDIVRAETGEELLSLGKEISFYEGYEGGERWSEGSRRATALFKVPSSGSYRLQVSNSERGDNVRSPDVTVVVRQGVLLARWFIILLIATALAALYNLIRRGIFEGRRWAPVTSDDD